MADMGLPQSQDPALYPQLGSPQRNAYAPAAHNNHQMAEPFVQQSSLSDAYANPPASGPHRDTSYLRLDRSNMASGRRPCPSRPGSDTHPSLPALLPGLPGSALTLDHYAQRASTPDPQKTPEAETSAPRLMRSPLGGETATRKQVTGPGRARVWLYSFQIITIMNPWGGGSPKPKPVNASQARVIHCVPTRQYPGVQMLK